VDAVGTTITAFNLRISGFVEVSLTTVRLDAESDSGTAYNAAFQRRFLRQ
jgi:hypothetical protein